MPAIDFPNSPSLNQEFNTGTIIYVWNGSTWNVKSSSQPPSSSIVSYSANAPSNPATGQVWVESDVDINSVDTTNFYTKSEVDNSLSSKANLASPTFTGTPAAPTANSGTNTTQIATTAFVNTAITNLINGAPGALDTLDELAAALGDDSNFATTITNSLASKAPLASPTLTGTPAAPTAAVGTDTTQIATTAFVNAEISNDAIVKSILDAKGDLIVASADNTPTKLTAGNNGDVIYSDSSATNGLRYQPIYSTGKNKIINGDFSTWQRGTSITPASGYGYGPDRWITYSYAVNSGTISRQSFTTGSAPVSGYESAFFCRVNSTSAGTYLSQRIEDVRTLAGQTATLSFWAKAASTPAAIGTINAAQVFGTGGSANAAINVLSSSISLSTSWQRYSVTFTVPSISGKTIGPDNYLWIEIFPGVINVAVDFWGIQLEAGSIATPFEQEPYAETLRKCQRYYQLVEFIPALKGISTTAVQTAIPFSVEMRAIPSSVSATAPLIISNDTAADYTQSSAQVSIIGSGLHASTRGARIQLANFTGLTSGTMYTLYNNASRAIAFNAEL